MDKNGNLFFGMLNPLALACWVSAAFSSSRLVVSNLIYREKADVLCTYIYAPPCHSLRGGI